MNGSLHAFVSWIAWPPLANSLGRPLAISVSSSRQLSCSSSSNLLLWPSLVIRGTLQSRIWWPRICLAECRAEFHRIGVPTPLDLAQCVAADVCRAVRAASPAWSGLTSIQLPAPRPKFAAPTSIFTAVASYLVELGLAHVHEEVYAQGMRLGVFSLAAFHLALHAFERSPIAVWHHLCTRCGPRRLRAASLPSGAVARTTCQRPQSGYPRICGIRCRFICKRLRRVLAPPSCSSRWAFQV